MVTNNNSGNSGGKYIYFKFWQTITSRMREGIVQTTVLKAIEDYKKGDKSVQDLRDLLIEFCTTEKEDSVLYALLPINNAKEDAIDDAWNELWAANADDIEDASMEEEEGHLVCIKTMNAQTSKTHARFWTPDEKAKFLTGLKQFGQCENRWVKVAEFIGTKNAGE